MQSLSSLFNVLPASAFAICTHWMAMMFTNLSTNLNIIPFVGVEEHRKGVFLKILLMECGP